MQFPAKISDSFRDAKLPFEISMLLL